MKKRKLPDKYKSKYYKKYGYSIKDVSLLLGWSYGTVHAYFNDARKRKMMLELVEMKKANND